MAISNVLLVDGDPCSLGLMAQGLSQQGLDVISVAGSAEALYEISRQIPSLVISDVEPSGADGMRLLERLRRDPRMADVPVLLLAKGEWTRLYRAEAQKLGAEDLLSKPLFVQDIATLGKMYAGHAAGEESFTGDLREVRCHLLLRGLLAGGRSGQLSFDPAGGRIYFQDGKIIDAVLPPLSADRALQRLLTFEQGRYRLRFGPIDRPQNLSVDVRELSGRRFDQLRQWETLQRELGPLDARPVVDFRRLSGGDAALSPAIYPLLRLFDGHRTVSQILDAAGVDDLIGAQAILKLRALGLLGDDGQEAAELECSSLAAIAVPAEIAIVAAPPAEPEALAPAALAAALGSFATPSAAEPFPGEALEDQAIPPEASSPQDSPAALVTAMSLEAEIDSFFGEATPAVGESAVELEGSGLAASAPRTAEPSSSAAGLDSLESLFFDREKADAELFAGRPTELPAQGALPVAQPRRSRRLLLPIAAAASALALFAVLRPAPVPAARVKVAPPAALPKLASHTEALSPLPAPPDPALAIQALIDAGKSDYDHGKLALAEKSFAQAAAARPDDQVAALYLGLTRYEQGHLTEAIAPLERARSLAPTNDRADVLLGAVYQELGRSSLARARYEEYLRIAPKGEHTQEVRTILASFPAGPGSAS